MFKKLLSRVGIGAPRITRVVHDPEIVRGQTLHGEVHILGGKSALTVNQIELSLQTDMRYAHGEARSYKTTLRQASVGTRFRLAAGESRILPFELLVPLETPISLSLTQVWIKTELDVAWAADPHEHAPIRILPDPATAHVLERAKGLGFEQSDLSGYCMGFAEDSDMPLSQVFELTPSSHLSHRLKKGVKDLTLLVRANYYDTEIQLEVNRQGQPPSPWLPNGKRQDERRLVFRLRHNERFPEGELEAFLLKLGTGPVTAASEPASQHKP
jgi:sporulation-control protein